VQKLFAIFFAVGMGAPTMLPAADMKPANACFRSQDIVNWVAANDRMMNIRVRQDGVYQLKLRGPCADFARGETVAFSTKGTRVCRGSDLAVIGEVPRVRAADASRGLSCGVVQYRKLSDAEVAALPAKERP
jgi:hypothetical protein